MNISQTTSNMLLSSKYRDRILYPSPTNFSIVTNFQTNSNNSLANAINPTTLQYPVYNFNFSSYSQDRFETTIISIQGDTLFLNDNISSVIGSTEINSNKLSQLSGETIIDMIRGFFIEVNIADTVFYREILSYNPTDQSVVLRNSFPFVMNESTEIQCFLTNRSSGKELICNGAFLHTNDFLYGSNMVVYNLRLNEFRDVESKVDNVLTLESSFSGVRLTDQYFLFQSRHAPRLTGTILAQPNTEFHSYQYGRINIVQQGSGYAKNTTVILKPVSEEYDPTFSYHEYELVDLLTKGQIVSEKNIKLTKIGDQQLEINTNYEIYDILQTSTSPAMIYIMSLSSTFILSIGADEIHNNQNNLTNSYFFPLLLSKQFVMRNGELYVQPNNSILGYDHLPGQRNIQEFETTNGLFPIKESYELEDGSIAIKTRLIDEKERIDYLTMMTDSNEEIYQGITNFMILDYHVDGVQSLNINFMKKEEEYTIRVRDIVLPNLSIKNTSCKVSDLPYIIFDLKNKTKATNYNKNNIQSNNPHVANNKFILHVGEDMDTTIDFIKIHCELCQELSFNPYDNLEVTFRLPDGTILEFDKKEHGLPIVANDKLECIVFLEILKKKTL